MQVRCILKNMTDLEVSLSICTTSYGCFKQVVCTVTANVRPQRRITIYYYTDSLGGRDELKCIYYLSQNSRFIQLPHEKRRVQEVEVLCIQKESSVSSVKCQLQRGSSNYNQQNRKENNWLLHCCPNCGRLNQLDANSCTSKTELASQLTHRSR